MAAEQTTTGTAPGPSRATLGLTGLTINAMALDRARRIPVAHLSRSSRSTARPWPGRPCGSASSRALLLCFATAISYAELSKLYPGAGSSYFFAEQAFLVEDEGLPIRAHREVHHRAGRATFTTGSIRAAWSASPRCISGYLLNQFFPDTFSGGFNSPLFMYLFCIAFALGVAYIAFRGVTGTTGVNMVDQRRADHRAPRLLRHGASRTASSTPRARAASSSSTARPIDFVVAQEPVVENGKPKLDATGAARDCKTRWTHDGNPVPEMKDGKPVPFILSYAADQADTMEPVDADHPKDLTPHFKFHTTAGSVVAPHGFSFMFIQACIAILILVGFESVTSMGEEAKNAKRDIPRAVLLSLGDSGHRLLPDRVLRGELLPEPGLHA